LDLPVEVRSRGESGSSRVSRFFPGGDRGQLGSDLTADDGCAAAEEAKIAPRRAVAAGWPDVALVRTDTDLDPSRSRSDFQLLMMDMAMPADPFARPD
jgi:hypothetical protein